MPRKRNRAPFESFGADIKKARKALGYSQRVLAEMAGIATRYLANIENIRVLPSMPVFYELLTICKLPVERYFYPAVAEARRSEQRERIALKLDVCPERYLVVIEGAIDAAIKSDEAGND